MEQREKRRAPLLFTEETDSTNLALRRLAAEGAADGTVLCAARQTAGRGRLGRSFASPEGGLYYSMLLAASEDVERDLLLTPAAGLATCRAIERVCAVRCGIKWPNDLLLDGKKVCGMLAEGFASASGRWIALGIGVNVNSAAFPPELVETAASLRQLTGRRTELRELAEALTEELDAAIPAARRGDPALLADYRARCLTIGQAVRVIRDGKSREAEALGVGEDYALSVRYADGSVQAVRSGEVSIR